MAAPNTPAAKTERLLNLTMTLLYARMPAPKQRIRQMVEAYRAIESDEAFDRMFERDKEDLRAMGIPLVTEDIGVFEDEQGYRIDRRDYALPPVELAADERAVVGLASRVWAHATMAGTAATAWRKVAAGDEVGEDPFVGLEPQLGGTEPAFEPLKDAVLSSTAVRFDYARPGTGGSRPRRVEPWYLTAWHGRWYLVGHDLDREAARVFRLSRITSSVTATGDALTVPVPDDVDPVRMIAATDPSPSETVPARLRVRVGTGHGLRRRAHEVVRVDDDWDRVDVPGADLDGFVSEVVSHGGDVVVEEPSELREAVIGRLRAVATAHEGSAR
ncbi:helix-turn-helix transcriptional regulator [Janibacter indicus]|uniref:helix-turn-helix transcriptional regulator n=1 Tax=Janibacter indicus TaxID=857417 RepID=UPI003EBA9F6D